MGDPIVYVSTWRIREGRFADYERFYDALWRKIEANEPDVAAFVAFANDDLTEIVNVHVYPDQATLDRHMQVLAEQMHLLPADLTPVTELMEPISIQVLGRPSGAAADMDDGLRAAGVPFTAMSRFMGGFTRKRP